MVQRKNLLGNNIRIWTLIRLLHIYLWKNYFYWGSSPSLSGSFRGDWIESLAEGLIADSYFDGEEADLILQKQEIKSKKVSEITLFDIINAPYPKNSSIPIITKSGDISSLMSPV